MCFCWASCINLLRGLHALPSILHLAAMVGLKIRQITSVLCSKHSVASQVTESKISVTNFKMLKPKTGPPLQSSPLMLILFPQYARHGPIFFPWGILVWKSTWFFLFPFLISPHGSSLTLSVRPSPSFLYFSP